MEDLLTGIGKIFNGIKYDFPIEECVMSVLEGASKFILVVCEDSEDDTVAFCKDLEGRLGGRLQLLSDRWRVSPDEKYENMVRLANKAISSVSTRWFWSVDMDEVMPVGESRKLHGFIKSQPGDVGCILLNFNHLYATLDKRIIGKLYDKIHRVARTGWGWKSGLDGCGLLTGRGRIVDSNIWVNHYGFVREVAVMVEKEMRFQKELFCGVDGLPDQRLIDEVENGFTTDKIEFYTKFATTDKILPYVNPPHQPSIIKRWG